MKTPWEEMSFLEKVWASLKFAFNTPIGYTPSELAGKFSGSDVDNNHHFRSSSTLDVDYYDDSPSRGLWDPTSTYYPMMHSDEFHIIDNHSAHSSMFDI